VGMIYIDSDIAILWIHERISSDQLFSLIDKNESLAITSASIFEIYQGYYQMIFNKKTKKSAKYVEKEKNAIEKLRVALIEIPMDAESAQKAAEIFQELSNAGEMIDLFDCLIAGIILTHQGDVLITRNNKHFERIPGLKLILI
jgi:predicted nucleic acid-binding protein